MVGPYEVGEWVAGDERPSLLSEAVAMVIEGKTRHEIAQAIPETYARFHRAIWALQATQFAERQQPPVVILYYGPSGCGKSRLARSFAGDSYWVDPLPSNNSSFWMDGYDGQTDAIFDDVDGRFSGTTLKTWLRLLDRYALRVPVKGGFIDFRPETIHLTTNYHPREWYEWLNREPQYVALVRRITRVLYWRSDGATFDLSPDISSWITFFAWRPSLVEPLPAPRIGVQVITQPDALSIALPDYQLPPNDTPLSPILG